MLWGKSTRDYHTYTLKIKKHAFTDQGSCSENLPKSCNHWALQFFVFMHKKIHSSWHTSARKNYRSKKARFVNFGTFYWDFPGTMEGDFIAVLAGIGAKCWELRLGQFLKHGISHAKVGACYINTSVQIILVLFNSNPESILLQENNIIQRKDIRCFLSVKKLMLSINEREKHHMFFNIYRASVWYLLL